MTSSDQTIGSLFSRPITRHINGVIKADQMDAASVWQELDEFVVTGELQDRLRSFFDAYTQHLDRSQDAAAAKMGVWMSGFFGSGKSHLLKVLAHLLRNQVHRHGEDEKQAVAFFEGKIHDAMMLADIKRATQLPTDVILFNIDSKANASDGDQAILGVFLRVLNELQGFCQDHPHIAHLERHLAAQGKLDTFKQAFAEATGSKWEQERDAYIFHRDEVVATFTQATGQSAASAEKWVDGAEDLFKLSVEKLAQWTREYLDSKGPSHRLLFFVDEIGQFIGSNTRLMLNLQTITENLGTACQGRAWVVVTSQEDMDSVIGDVKTSKANDFSKIQGRFATKLSLSSANVDEVIQERLLRKTDEATNALTATWQSRADQLKHQVALPHTKATFKGYGTQEDFVRNYPFVPYQFKLLQNVFEAIRKVGASGQHLSRGERSILDAFQGACKQVLDQPIGCLVPLWRFYPAIEGFLDTAVAQTIRQAEQTPTLDTFDAHLLQSLFLIRYVKSLPGSPDNLVSLLLEDLEQDRLALKERIKASLDKLERESLVKRTGEHYFFLTNEERDIAKQIQHVELDPGEAGQAMAKLLFEETPLLGTLKKHRHAESRMDFDLHRVLDNVPFGTHREEGLRLSVVSPIAEDREAYDANQCLMKSGLDHGQVIVVLEPVDRLEGDFRLWLRTEKYRRRKDDNSQSESAKRILAEVDADNQTRLKSVIEKLAGSFDGAKWYVNSQAFDPTGARPAAMAESALDFLVDSTFTKRRLLDKPLETEAAKREIQSVLRSNDADKQLLQLAEANHRAAEEVRQYIGLCDAKSEQMILADTLRRFEKRPYAWPAMDTALIVARLLVGGELELIKDGSPKTGMQAYDLLVTPNLRKLTRIRKRRTAAPATLRRAVQLGRELFGQILPDEELKLFEALHAKLAELREQVTGYRPLAESGRYPGLAMIDASLVCLKTLLQDTEPASFLDRFIENRDPLLEAEEDIQTLRDFYSNQKSAWERLLNQLHVFEHNRYELKNHPEAAAALHSLQQIREMDRPFTRVREIDGLLNTVQQVNDHLLAEARVRANAELEALRKTLQQDLDQARITGEARERCLKPLSDLALTVDGETVLGQLQMAGNRAHQAFDTAQAELRRHLTPAPAPGSAPGAPGTPGAPGSGPIPAPGATPEAPDAEASPTPPPLIKPATTLRASEIAGPAFIESEEQAEAVLNALRNQIRQALAKGHRVQIR